MNEDECDGDEYDEDGYGFKVWMEWLQHAFWSGAHRSAFIDDSDWRLS
jgi:hypothetical protein